MEVSGATSIQVPLPSMVFTGQWLVKPEGLNPGTLYPVGVTTIELSAPVNGSDEVVSCSFNVVVSGKTCVASHNPTPYKIIYLIGKCQCTGTR